MATTSNNTPSEVGAQPTASTDSGDQAFEDALAAIGQAIAGGVGSGGGGPKKAPPDPYAPIMRSFFSAYFKIWGTLPPPGYVEGAARSMNLYEFIDQERKKPAYRHTKAYKNEAAKYAALRDQLLGYY